MLQYIKLNVHISTKKPNIDKRLLNKMFKNVGHRHREIERKTKNINIYNNSI